MAELPTRSTAGSTGAEISTYTIVGVPLKGSQFKGVYTGYYKGTMI